MKKMIALIVILGAAISLPLKAIYCDYVAIQAVRELDKVHHPTFGVKDKYATEAQRTALRVQVMLFEKKVLSLEQKITKLSATLDVEQDAEKRALIQKHMDEIRLILADGKKMLELKKIEEAKVNALLSTWDNVQQQQKIKVKTKL